MMDDLIKRQDAIDALGEEPPVWYDGDDEIAERNQWRRDKAAIESLPSAEPKTGEWDLCKDDDGVYGVCSICGCYVDFSLYGRPYKVCPHCGARMKGADNE